MESTLYAKVCVLNFTSTQSLRPDLLFFPLTTVRCHNNDKPWINPKIKSLIRSRQSAFSKGEAGKFRLLRNQVKSELRKCKVNYYANRVRELQSTDPRKWHQQIRSMTRNDKAGLCISIPGISEHDHTKIADSINEAFIKVSSGVPPLDLGTLEAFLPAPSLPPKLHPWDVYAQLSRVKPGKSSGPDGISPKVIKEFAYEFPICDILNSSYNEGVLPQQWKKAIVVPIPKSNPPRADKLRPISLTDCFAKIAESFITKWVLEDIGDKIDPHQFGNIKGVSTSHYLVSLLHFLHQGADRAGNVGTVVLTDFSKAFDMVDHTLMIEKFIRLGVRRSIVPWLCGFLSNRMQCVRYNQTLSTYKTLTGGLPQGTKLGPIGFQTIINDAVKDVPDNMNRWKYVDDLTLAENRSYLCNSQLQEIFNQFSQWCDNNMLCLNPTKCQALQICYKQQVPVPAVLQINQCPLQFVDHAKILGVWIQNNLQWTKNISEISVKANRKLYMLRLLKKFGFTKPELVTVYKGYILPLLDYADVVWHSSITCKQSSQLETLQRRACRIVLGSKFTSYNDALQDCELESLSSRREDHCQRFAEGLAKSTRTMDLLPPTRYESHSRNLRSGNNVSQLRTRTSRFRNSPIPYFVNLLNR